MISPIRTLGCLTLVAALAVRAAPAPTAPTPAGVAELAALRDRDRSKTLGELQAGRERPSILVPLMVVGFLSIVVWSVAGDDERETVTFETLNTGDED